MRTAAENERHCQLRLASFYRRKARIALAQARQARWVGREEVVAALVREARWWRRFGHRWEGRARQKEVPSC
jgi:hypothetical protein